MQDASYRLKCILERDFGIHCNDDDIQESGIEDLQLTLALSQLKETRRRRSQRDAKDVIPLCSEIAVPGIPSSIINAYCLHMQMATAMNAPSNHNA